MRPDAPPPIPQRLREMLSEYPEQLQILQTALNRVVERPSSGAPLLEQAIWALETTLTGFAVAAREETKVAEASGDRLAIERSTSKQSLIFRAASKIVWLGDKSLIEYFRTPGGSVDELCRQST